MNHITKHKVLKKGARIAIAASSSPFLKEKFHKGVEVLKSFGFEVEFSDDIFRKTGYLAGSDEERASELNGFLKDPKIDAIMFARGGYGVQRIMDRIDFEYLKNNPKLIIGYSDLTALLSYVTTNLNISAVYGPVVTALDNDTTVDSLKNILVDKKNPESISLKVLKSGNAEGTFVGGCLTMIQTSVGTPYQLSARNKILFLEDANEKIYHYDRILTHMKNSGMLKGVKGIVFGPMNIAKSETRPEKLWPMIADVLKDFSGPVVYGLSSGHIEKFISVPLGVKSKIIANNDKAELVFEETVFE